MGNDQPELPYGRDDPDSGWSGSETSRSRAKDADAGGATARRQRQALDWLAQAEGRGATWKELAEWMGWHHGQASSVLSVLHKTGRISRLTETRLRCKVYVANDYVNDRATEPHGRTTASGLLDRAVEVLRDMGPCRNHTAAWPNSQCVYCRGDEVVAEYDRRK